MKVKDLMTAQPRVCSRDTNLAAAAALMLDGDCDILPVLKDGKLVGVVTDCDLHIALATRNVRASQVTVGDVLQARCDDPWPGRASHGLSRSGHVRWRRGQPRGHVNVNRVPQGHLPVHAVAAFGAPAGSSRSGANRLAGPSRTMTWRAEPSRGNATRS